ncbi:MAG: glycerol dehydrogenase [Methanomassiliicoccales archaeon]
MAAPNRYIFGPGATKEIGTRKSLLGTKPFILGGTRSIGQVEDQMKEDFDENGIEPVHWEKGVRYCTMPEIDRLTEAAKEKGADFIVGVGGGSIMDLAKAVASERRLQMPIALINTIPSTDAPCSALSVVYDENHAVEDIWMYYKNPDLVLVPTDVTIQAPVKWLVAGMGDALATRFEAEAVRDSYSANALIDGARPASAATKLAQFCYENLIAYGYQAKLANEKQAITDAYDSVAMANTLLSGIGFESGGLAAAHGIHDGLTNAPGRVKAPKPEHGDLVAIGTLTQLIMENRSRELLEEVLNFCLTVGLPTTLEEIGVTYDDLEMCAKATCDPGHPYADRNVYPLTVDRLVDALKACDAIGTAYRDKYMRR